MRRRVIVAVVVAAVGGAVGRRRGDAAGRAGARSRRHAGADGRRRRRRRRRAPRWSDVVDRLSLGVVVSGVDRRSVALPQPRPPARSRARTWACSSTTPSSACCDGRAAGERVAPDARALRPAASRRRRAGRRRCDGGGAVATIEDVSERRRLDAVRTDFVANISHELKTPVGALAVLAETMADEDDLGRRAPRRRRGWSTRRTASSRTIDDLLELSRIELGEEPVRDVVDVVRRRRRARSSASRPLAEARQHRRSTCSSGAARRPRARRPPPAGVGARQPGRERREVQRDRARRCRCGCASRARGSS